MAPAGDHRLAARVIGGVYLGYDLYKFPPGSTAGHAEIMKNYAPVWTGNPAVALLAMSVSLSAGVPFYNPAILICLSGLRAWWSREKLFCLSLSMAIAVFILFISSLTFFKGDPAWGPRYLTPIFAVLWLFAPAGSRLLRKWVVSRRAGAWLDGPNRARFASIPTASISNVASPRPST